MAGLFVIAAAAAPLRSSAVDIASQEALNEMRKSEEAAANDVVLFRKKHDLAIKLEKIGFRPYRYCEDAGCAAPDFNQYILTVRRWECDAKGKAYFSVDGIFSLTPPKPKLTIREGDVGITLVLGSTSIDDFLAQTSNTALIKEKIAKLKLTPRQLQQRCAPVKKDVPAKR